MDNLDSQTYEIFEKDPIKYVQYEKVSIHFVPLCTPGSIYCTKGTYLCGYSKTLLIQPDKLLKKLHAHLQITAVLAWSYTCTCL